MGVLVVPSGPEARLRTCRPTNKEDPVKPQEIVSEGKTMHTGICTQSDMYMIGMTLMTIQQFRGGGWCPKAYSMLVCVVKPFKSVLSSSFSMYLD